jgi:hypothetical protein
LKTSRKPRVNVIDAGNLLTERIRASLSRSPFLFLGSTAPLPEEEVDLYVAPVDLAVEILRPRDAAHGDSAPQSGTRSAPPGSLIPVIAFGPSGYMRSAFISGAADYIREPWGPEELELRAARALKEIRRKMEFPWGTLKMDGGLVETPSGNASLTLHESRILQALLLNRGAPVSREALAYRIWKRPGPEGSRAIDVHVAAIRRKLKPLIPGSFILAARNEGYIVQ